MKLFTSTWFIAILALIINLGVVWGTLFSHKKEIIELAVAQQPEEHEETLSPIEPAYWTLRFSEFDTMVEAVKARDAALTEREASLEAQAAALEAERQQLQKMQEAVKAEQRALDEILFGIEDHERDNLRFLATTYAAMDPKSVVPIWEQMSDEQVMKIILQMKPDVVASIFAAMIERDDEAGAQSERVARIAREIRRFRRPDAKANS